MVGQELVLLAAPALQGAGRLVQVPVLLQLPAGVALQVGQQQDLLWTLCLQPHGCRQSRVDVPDLACSRSPGVRGSLDRQVGAGKQRVGTVGASVKVTSTLPRPPKPGLKEQGAACPAGRQIPSMWQLVWG